MRRFSDENGFAAAARNWGRLALMLMPAALGGAACLWVLAASGWIDLTKELRAERRALQSVGLVEVPTTPIRFKSFDAKCLKIDAAYMDGGDHFVFYAKNVCSYGLKLPNYRYALKAADGTVLESGTWAFNNDKRIEANERREQRIWIEHGTTRIDLIEIHGIDD